MEVKDQTALIKIVSNGILQSEADKFKNFGIECCSKGQYDKAKDMFEKALELTIQIHGEHHPFTATSYNNLGLAYYLKGDGPKAVEFLTKGLEIREEVFGRNSANPEIAASYNNLASAYQLIGDYENALEAHQKALDLRIEVFGEEHPETASSYDGMGLVLREQGVYDISVEMHERSLAIRQKTLEKNHPQIAASYNNLGIVLEERGEFNQAIACHRKALEIRHKVFGEQHMETANSLNNLVGNYISIGDYDRAIDCGHQALHVFVSTVGENHFNTAQICSNLGRALGSKGWFQQALYFAQRGLDIKLAIMGEMHPETASSFNILGGLHCDIGSFEQASILYQKALDIRIALYGDNHPDLASTYNNMGVSLFHRGDFDRALEMQQKALNIYLNSLGDEHSNISAAYNNIAMIYSEKGDYQRSIETHQKALEIRIKAGGENHPDVASSQLNLGSTFSLLEEYSKALEFYSKAEKIYFNCLGEDHYLLGRLYASMASCKGIPEEERRSIGIKSLKLFLRFLGGGHPQTFLVMSIIHNNRNIAVVKENTLQSKKINAFELLDMLKREDDGIQLDPNCIDFDFIFNEIPRILNVDGELTLLKDGKRKRIFHIDREICLVEFRNAYAAELQEKSHTSIEREGKRTRQEIVTHFLLGLMSEFPTVHGIMEEEKDQHYTVVVEYVQNESLEGIFRSNLTWAIRLRICLEIVEAIQTLHSFGLVHCDIHLGNFLVTKDMHIKVNDFELAVPIVQGSGKIDFDQRNVVFAGASLYAAPELILCEYGLLDEKEMAKLDFRKCDIWSAGAVLVSVLTGKYIYQAKGPKSSLEFDRDSLKVKLERNNHFPEELGEIEHEELKEIIEGMLNWNWRDRTDLEQVAMQLGYLYSGTGFAFEEICKEVRQSSFSKYCWEAKNVGEFVPIAWMTFSEIGTCIIKGRELFVKKYFLKREQCSSSSLQRWILRECEVLAFAKECSAEHLLQLEGLYVDHQERSLWMFTKKYDFTLKDILSRIQSSDRLLALVIRSLCLGLLYLHENGYLHRDLKLQNVMVNTNGLEVTEVVLIDFGNSINIVDKPILSTPLPGLSKSGVSSSAQKMYDLKSLHKLLVNDVLPKNHKFQDFIPQDHQLLDLKAIADEMQKYSNSI
jgi:tetratricopeptide (TPR) repeat protein/serine/threonine protein kinase